MGGTEAHIYAFGSTTIALCLSIFDWAKFRKKKGGIKVHTLFDVIAGVPTFVHITESKVHDMNAMDDIPYEVGSFYIFDRGYNDYSRLYTIHRIGATFILRAKNNVKYIYARNCPNEHLGYFSECKGSDFFDMYKYTRVYV